MSSRTTNLNLEKPANTDYVDVDVINSNSDKIDTFAGQVLNGDYVQDSNYVHTDNNFTSTLKNKLDGVEANANNYSLPTASTGTLGGVKVDGSTITIDSNGIISSTGGGGGGTTVIANPSGTATAALEKLQVGQTIYSSGGTTVIGNPSGTATADLEKIQIGNSVFKIPEASLYTPTGLSYTVTMEAVASKTQFDCFLTEYEDGTQTAQNDYSFVKASAGISEVTVGKVKLQNASGNIQVIALADMLQYNGNVFNTNDVIATILLPSTNVPAVSMTIEEVEFPVAWNQIQESGAKIAEITIDGNTTDVYAPAGDGSGSTVEWTQIVQSGTKIAEIEIDGVSTDVYAPASGGEGGIIYDKGYSTTEQAVCGWTDGTTVYQKTFYIAGDGNTKTFTENTGITNGKKLVQALVSGVRHDTGEHFAQNYINIDDSTWSTSFVINSALTQFTITAKQYAIEDIIVTLRYLKTTDVPFTGVLNIDELSDVDITTPTNGQVLAYNSTTNKWENANGGSSGGGHTILDDNGTALAQESNLQFNGVYAHDDSTNEKTVVEITRSMTKDQYNNLSDDEKLGVIEVIDEDDVKVCYDIEGVLRAGEDRITFSHEAINDNSTLDPYTNEVGVSPVDAFLSVDTSYTKATIEVVTTSVSGSGASVSVTYKDEEGSTISTQSLRYDDVIGEENAYVLDDILEVFYDSDNLSWVVKALSLCGYDDAEYETGDVISTWVYSESVDMEIEQYSTVGSVTYVFPVQNHDVAVKLRITSRDCGPLDVSPHIVDYSTEEQNTGVRWLDGNYVYQKTYTGTIGDTGITVIDSDVSGITIIGEDTWIYASNGLGTSLGAIPNSGTWINCLHINSSHQLCLHNESATTGGTYYVTIKYIKTTS